MSLKNELVKTFQNLLGIYFGKVYSNSEIKVSSMEVGGKVELINPDGSLTDAPDGDYVMEDGSAFTVKDGMISSIVGQDQSVQVVNQEEVSTEELSVTDQAPVEEPVQPVEDSKVSELEIKVSELEQKVNDLISSMESMQSEKMESEKVINQFNEQVSLLNKNITELAKVPVEFSKTNKSVTVEESREDKLSVLATIIGNAKK